MVAYWIQGLRSEISKPARSWITITQGRILGVVDHIPSGAKTSQSEQLLSIGANTYFYIGFMHPFFGRQVFAFEPDFSGRGKMAFKVSPFDTGALATGRIQTDPDILQLESEDQKRGFVERYSFGRSYQTKFSEWTKTVFSEDYISDYVDGTFPSKHYCAGIVIPKSGDESDARCWVWEARTSKSAEVSRNSDTDYTVDLCLCHIWMNADDMDLLKRKMIDNPEYAVGDKKRMLEFLNDKMKLTRVGSGEASAVAQEWLEVRQQW